MGLPAPTEAAAGLPSPLPPLPLPGSAGVLTRQLERSSHGLLPALGVQRHQGQARQPQDESELARSEGHRGNQVAGSHHVELHWRGQEERRQVVSTSGRLRAESLSSWGSSLCLH